MKINVQTRSEGNWSSPPSPPSKETNVPGQRHASILFLLKFTNAITMEMFDAAFKQAYVRVRSTDFNKASNDDRGIDWRSIYTTYHSTTRLDMTCTRIFSLKLDKNTYRSYDVKERWEPDILSAIYVKYIKDRNDKANKYWQGRHVGRKSS